MNCKWEDPQLGAFAQAICHEVAALQHLDPFVVPPDSLEQQAGSNERVLGSGGVCEEVAEVHRGLQARAKRISLTRRRHPLFDLAGVAKQLSESAASGAARLDLPDFTKFQRQQARAPKLSEYSFCHLVSRFIHCLTGTRTGSAKHRSTVVLRIVHL